MIAGECVKAGREHALPGAQAVGRTPSALFMTESDLWTRFSPSVAGGWKATAHASGPAASDSVPVTPNTAMVAMLRGELSMSKATSLGVLAGEGPKADAAYQGCDTMLKRFSHRSLTRFDLHRPMPFTKSFSPLTRTLGPSGSTNSGHDRLLSRTQDIASK